MHVGVLGGGLQGCCVALALAERSVNVTLVDRNDALLSRAAIANEGKVHLGYMYAGDPSLATAKTMISGALAFALFFERQLCQSMHLLATSAPATYVVHRDSQRSCSDISAYLEIVHGLVNEAAEGRREAYFGKDLRPVLRPWSAAQIEEAFDPAIASAAFDTPEVAINPLKLAHALREVIAVIHGSKCDATGLSSERTRSAKESGYGVTDRKDVRGIVLIMLSMHCGMVASKSTSPWGLNQTSLAASSEIWCQLPIAQ